MPMMHINIPEDDRRIMKIAAAQRAASMTYIIRGLVAHIRLDTIHADAILSEAKRIYDNEKSTVFRSKNQQPKESGSIDLHD